MTSTTTHKRARFAPQAFLLAVVAVALPGARSAQAAPSAYFGVYLKRVKIGSLSVQRDVHAMYQGKPAIRTESRMQLTVQSGTTATCIVSTNIGWAAPKTGLPLASDSRTVSGGAETRVRATYTDSSVRYVAQVTGSEQKATLRLKAGEHFLADPFGIGQPVAVGKTFRGKVFQTDPALLRLSDSRLRVLGQTTLTVGGTPRRAFQVEDKNPAAPAMLYLTPSGELLRTENALGVRIERQDKATALAPATASPDISRVTAVKPTGDVRFLHDEPTVRYRISGLPRPLPPSDTVQQLLSAPTEAPASSAIVTVTAAGLPVASAARFAQAADAPKPLQAFLQPTLYVSSDTSEFRALARTLVGDETNLARAALKIARYVHQTMAPDSSISNLRSARDIHRSPRGVCRDYTLYFTAIARAAGIPTKQCVGVVLTDGVFAGHAWPEVWTGTGANGQEQWVALEPTWGEPFADATHIKLSEGELTDYFTIAADFDRLSIQVIPAPAESCHP